MDDAVARGIAGRCTPEQARVIVVDPRRGLLGDVPDTHLIGYASTAEQAGTAARTLAESLRKRLPGREVTPRALRERSWWRGPEVYLLVDDYDLVAPPGTAAHPLLPIAEFLPQAKDVGLHLIVCRRTGGAARALFESVIQRIRELGSPGIVGAGSRDEGVLLGTTRPTAMPPGRGVIVGRRFGTQLIQIADL